MLSERDLCSVGEADHAGVRSTDCQVERLHCQTARPGGLALAGRPLLAESHGEAKVSQSLLGELQQVLTAESDQSTALFISGDLAVLHRYILVKGRTTTVIFVIGRVEVGLKSSLGVASMSVLGTDLGIGCYAFRINETIRPQQSGIYSNLEDCLLGVSDYS